MSLESFMNLLNSKCAHCCEEANMDIMLQENSTFLVFCSKSCRKTYLKQSHPNEPITRTAICRYCRKTEDVGHNQSLQTLKYCSRCKSARYCSPECQRTDWPEHKKECFKK